MRPFHPFYRHVSCFILGVVFIASGVLKLVDPVGTGLIVTGYFKLFNLAAGPVFARVLGILLALTESLLGVALFTRVPHKITAPVTFSLLGLFTALTLYLCLSRSEMECGCFGEAIHMTPLQSLLKNILLLIFAYVYFARKPEPLGRMRWTSFILASAGLIFGCVYSQRHLPAVDFTEFAPGNELFSAEGNLWDGTEVRTLVHIYKRGSQTGQFAPNRVPDTSWKFVRADTVSRNGLALPLHRPVLSFTGHDGEYMDHMAVTGKVLVISVYAPTRLGADKWDKIRTVMDLAAGEGAETLLLVPVGTDETWIPFGLRSLLYRADQKTLLTFNRSNGGASWIDNGLIVSKWAFNGLPDKGDIAWLMTEDPVEAVTATINRDRLRFQGFALYLAAILLLL